MLEGKQRKLRVMLLKYVRSLLGGEEEADGENIATFELLMTTCYQTPISALNIFLP